MAQGHRDLLAWQKAMALVTDVYELTRRFPKEEQFGLTAQLRRAAVSIPSNIAEGHGRSSRRELKMFVNVARGSLLEVETQLEIARNLGYVDERSLVTVMKRSNEVGKILTGLRLWCDRNDKDNADRPR